MKKIIIAGGTGFLGTCLKNHWKHSENEIHILSRHHHLNHDNVFYHKWDGKHLGSWAITLEDADVLINLNGKSVDCRYTEANKDLIYDTRVEATHVLGAAVMRCKQPPKLWINAASATIYRHSEDKEMDELHGEIGKGFSVDVCQKWEAAFNAFNLPATRKVIFRIGIVLGSSGGPMVPLMRLTKLGFGGKQGKGNQYFSWVHEEDLIRAFEFSMKNEGIEGVYNLTAPKPIPNTVFMSTMRKKLKAKIGIPMPEWLLEMGAFFIRTETELVLKSRRVVPRLLLAAGFKFKFNDIASALLHLSNKKI